MSSDNSVRILLIKHDDETTVGTALEWAETRGVSFEVQVGERLHATDYRKYDGVIVFGGDMQVWETEKHPWLAQEKAFLKNMIDSDRGVFGICLGAQLLAEQLHATVAPQGFWNFGWSDVTLTEEASLVPFHCHESCIEPAPIFDVTASNSLVPVLGFRSGERLVGYQFHCEIDEARINHILKNREPMHGFVQSELEVITKFLKHEASLKAWFFQQLDQWRETLARSFQDKGMSAINGSQMTPHGSF